MNFIYVIFIFTFITSCLSLNVCQQKCQCTEQTLLCRYTYLKNFPNISNQYIFKSIFLRGNQISIIKNGTMIMLKYLENLDLSFNRIKTIEANGLKGSLKLKFLNLKNNYIELLPDNIFNDFVYTLEKLVLSNNKLKNLPLSIEKLLNLKYIDISQNPLICVCQFKYFATFLKTIELSNQHAKCKFPATLKNINLIDVNFDSICSDYKPVSKHPPKLLNELREIKVAQREKVILNCETENVIDDNVTWNLPFPYDEYTKFYYRNHILVISEVNNNHSGVIQCEIKNIIGSIISTGEIKIVDNQRPYIIEGPQNQVVEKGSTVTFRCRALGYPKPNIDWLWLKTSVQKLETDNKFLIHDNKLIIRNVSSKEAVGRYICYVSSRAGSSKVSATITLIDSKSNNNINNKNSIVIRNNKIVELIEKAKIKINQVFNRTIQRLRNADGSSRGGISSLFRQPSLAALELARSSEVYESVLDEIISILRENKFHFNLSSNLDRNSLNNILTHDQIAIISQLSGCQRSTEDTYCSEQLCFHKKFRSINGKCNNLIDPNKGAALSPFIRLLLPEYENGISTPIGWTPTKLYYGQSKPSARLISTKLLHSLEITPDNNYSVMVMQWGQFLDHDITFTPVDASTSRFSDGLSCNETCVNDPPCFPIIIPSDDTRIRRPCMGFSRSIATCGSGHSSIVSGKLHSREQVNQITGFIDASNLYSSEDFEANELRDFVFDEGKLRVGMLTKSRKNLLPFTVRGQVDCQIEPSKSHVLCFKAGDHRSNENLGLLVMHTIWMREHNRIAETLRSLNNHWSGDRVYYETRKIIGAMMQHITYKHWLPLIIGSDGMKRVGDYKGYNDNVDPTISNVFATAAMRFGHGLINPILFRLDDSFNEIKEGHLPLHKAFFAPHRLFQDGGIDPILRGLYAKSAKLLKAEEPMNDELIEKLFALAHDVALDLGALNIQRGRDHGLPPYNKWRQYCNLRYGETFDEFSEEIKLKSIRDKMKEIYGHPSNVDLFVGGILEEHVEGGLVGPTFQCILIDQFRRLRDGDRFWYENHDQFESSQLAQIKRVNLNQIICENGDNITNVQSDVFFKPKLNDMMRCDKVRLINLLPWKECEQSKDIFNNRLFRTRRNAGSNLNDQFSKIDELEKRIKFLEKHLKDNLL